MRYAIVILLCLAGCATTERIPIDNPSGVNPRPGKFEFVEPPEHVWEPLPIDYTPSFPLAVYEYERPLQLHPETVAAVYEVILTDDTATIKTLEREYVIAQPAQGEEKIVRTGRYQVQEYVGGEPEELIAEIRRPGFFGRLIRWAAIIAALAAAVFLYFKFRGDKTDKMMDKLLKVMMLGALRK